MIARPAYRSLGAVLIAGLLLSGCSTEEAAPGHEQAGATAEAHLDSVVVLGREAVRTAGIAIELAVADDGRAGVEERVLEVPGHVELDPRRVAVLSARMNGRLEQLQVVPGEEVAEGEEVGALFGSTYLTAQSDVQQAARREALLAHTADSTGARVLAEAAIRRLRLLGESEPALLALRQGEPPRDLLVLRAPRAGSVIEAPVMQGRSVSDGDPLLTIADLTELDVVAEVPEVSLPQVRVGQRADVTVAAFPDRRFSGTVERLHDMLDPETRTVRAVLHVPNADRILRPGMYATVRLRLDRGTGGGSTGVLVPRSALVSDGSAMIVFVETAEGSYVRREVDWASLAPAGSMRAEQTLVLVRRGVAPGERVVVRGAFILKSEMGKSERGEHE